MDSKWQGCVGIDWNRCITFVYDVDSGEGYARGEGYIGILCTSIQICYELKTALQVKVCVKNYISLPSWPFTLFAISLFNVLYEN